MSPETADSVAEGPLSFWKRLLFGLVVVVGVPIAAFAMVEGSSSLLLLGRDLWRPVSVARERRHTQYDTLLGWASQPNFYDRDLYAPGVYLRTNAQGFRNDRVIVPQVPPGRIRVICSGDSFTLGWGVDNDHTWCASLARKSPGLETVNMGQGGYGADQAYLWYKRDARALDHDVQVLAVIAEDFQRIRQREFLGFGKPVLQLHADSLRLENVPVPRWSYRMPGLASHLFWKRQVIAQLRVAALVKRLSQRFTDPHPLLEADSTMRQVADRLLRDLASLNRAKRSKLVVVLLPTRADWIGNESDRWRRWLAAGATRDGYLFVDLVDDFLRLRRDSVDLLFLGPGIFSHYSETGHEWAAERLWLHLLRSSELATLFK